MGRRKREEPHEGTHTGKQQGWGWADKRRVGKIKGFPVMADDDSVEGA